MASMHTTVTTGTNSFDYSGLPGDASAGARVLRNSRTRRRRQQPSLQIKLGQHPQDVMNGYHGDGRKRDAIGRLLRRFTRS
jgi:hypothetical protein